MAASILKSTFVRQLRLWQAFWLVLVPSVLLTSGIFVGFVYLLRISGSVADLSAVLGFVLSLILAFWMALAVRAVWLCAANTDYRFWGHLAIAVSVVVFLPYIAFPSLVIFNQLSSS